MEHYIGCITEWFELPTNSTFTILPQGMRYLDIYVMGELETNFSLTLKFEYAGIAINQMGQFSSNLSLLDRIFEVSVHTNRICHQIGMWDGIKRDRLNWVYDFYMAAKANYVLWDDFSILKRSVLELGKTPDGFWMNSLPSYTLWWLNTIWEYYWHTGDRHFVLELRDDIHRHVKWVGNHLNQQTGKFAIKQEVFIEWVPIPEEDSWNALQAILVITRKNLMCLSSYIPELDLQIDWPEISMDDALFVEESKALITSLLGIVSGLVSREKSVHFLQSYELSDPITPISAYWLAECYSQFDMNDQAWQVISTVWGKMLEEDVSTFWESVSLSKSLTDFHNGLTTYSAYASYRISLCHSWSSTPVHWVSRYILGVKPMEPGLSKIQFCPSSLPGMNECEGVVPTSKGPIYVKWMRTSDGEIKSELRLPDGCQKIEPNQTRRETI